MCDEYIPLNYLCVQISSIISPLIAQSSKIKKCISNYLPYLDVNTNIKLCLLVTPIIYTLVLFDKLDSKYIKNIQL